MKVGKNKYPLISIIIRTKNEERWIKLCLDKVFKQTYKKFEIIIVDNYSTDKTLKKINKFDIKKIIKIKKFLPGKAINLGIKESYGEYIVILSAHCIPTNNYWLENFVKSIHNNKKNIVGVYGRQEPMNFSSSSNKRDMFLLFGLDKKIQKKDSFFHNANSCIIKSILEKIPFDNKVSNIEDRLWAEKVIKKGYKILYQPKSSVYHHHGVHQDDNVNRLEQVVKIVDKHIRPNKGKINPKELNILGLIPIKGLSKKINNQYLLKYTISSLKKSKYINDIIISTDNILTKKIAIKLGAKVPFLRPKKYSSPKTSLEKVQQYIVNKLEKNFLFPDIFFHLEETFPFRENDLIDSMIEKLLNEGFDTVIAARKEFRVVWKDNAEEIFTRIDSGDMPRKYKESMMIGYPGLGCVTYPEFIRNGKLLGNKIGLFEVENQISFFEVRSKDSINLAEKFLNLKLS
ncbi:MAG: hypothetical protein CFH15_01313 [Alphaproteobacteria bacterium MarineAlpha5_Bin5]|nr:MAG: hypothetical protein CFH15_01313 [Alphaproteobacteria bacterium MarineAlpha5_Bin5]|tara:strand:+ start:2996 stop:4369 length:1374 start_codon:yes stop_codon:yes gene_type:complete